MLVSLPGSWESSSCTTVQPPPCCGGDDDGRPAGSVRFQAPRGGVYQMCVSQPQILLSKGLFGIIDLKITSASLSKSTFAKKYSHTHTHTTFPFQPNFTHAPLIFACIDDVVPAIADVRLGRQWQRR